MTKIIISLMVALFAVSACSTIKGVGADVQKAGQAIENVAE